MTINVRLRKGATAVITKSVVEQALASREPGEDINVIVDPGARAFVVEDGATAEELRALLDLPPNPEA